MYKTFILLLFFFVFYFVHFLDSWFRAFFITISTMTFNSWGSEMLASVMLLFSDGVLFIFFSFSRSALIHYHLVGLSCSIFHLDPAFLRVSDSCWLPELYLNVPHTLTPSHTHARAVFQRQHRASLPPQGLSQKDLKWISGRTFKNPFRSTRW